MRGTSLHKTLGGLVLLYLVALHTSIAAMEICAWLASVIALGVMIRERRFPRFPIWIPALGLTVSVLIGLMLNPAGRGFWFQLGFLRWLGLLYFLPAVLRDQWSENFERRLIQLWTVMVLICAVYALFQTLTGIDLIRPAAGVISYQGGGTWRPTGFFSRSLAFAYAFGFSFLALSLPRFKVRPWFWGGLVVILGTLTIVGTDARGAWVGFVAAVLVYFSVNRPRDLLWFVPAVLAAVFLLIHSHTGIGDKLQRMVSLTMDNSSFERTHLWQGYFAMWKDHPWFGIGLLQGDVNLAAYYQKLGINEAFVSNAHNVYLQWLAGSGIFGLFFYLWLCAYFLRAAWRLRRTSPWGWSLLLAQIYLHVGAFTENNFFTAITNHMVLFGWAILLSLTYGPAKDGSEASC